MEVEMSKKITIGVLPFALSMACTAFVTFMLSRSQAAASEAVFERVASAQSQQGVWAYPDSLDAVTAAPNTHKILLENDRVRVLEVTVPPHSKEPTHTHRWPSVIHVDVPSKIRYYDAQGKVLFESGSVIRKDMKPVTRWLEPEAPHAVENVTDIPWHAIRVELKR
jgi:hypothetical protein